MDDSRKVFRYNDADPHILSRGDSTMTKTKLNILTGMIIMLMSAPLMAVESGFYLGGSLGGATTEFESGNFKFDENDVAWKVFGGYHFLQFFAVEGAYRNLGSPSNGIVKVEPSGFDVAGIAGLPLGPIYLFGKLGVIYWDADLSGLGSSSEDGTDYEVGIGASIDIWKIQLRAELEYFDIEEGAVMYTLGAAWRF
jgi:hypothetical protein